MKNDWLLDHRKNIASQHGEDGILQKVFQIIKGDKWCVEFGAWDGEHYSNTWNIITSKGWSGVLIEADKKRFKELVQRYAGNSKVHPFNLFVQFSGPDSLDNILKRTPIPHDFDFLCIDIDGADYHIWNALKVYKPKVVVIEYNPTIPNDVEYIPPKDMTVHHGTSLLALVNLGKRKGYELICVDDTNAFFIRKKYFPLFKITDNSPDELHNDHKYQTRLYQFYDGTIVIDGCDTLLWHNLAIDNKKIQVLPKLLRGFESKPKAYLKAALVKIGFFKRPRKPRS